MKLDIAARFRKTATARQKTALSPSLKLFAAAGLALSLGGCLGMDSEVVHGYQVDPRLLDQVKIGSSAEQALVVMGTPSTTSTVGGDAWYYITQITNRPVQFMDPSLVDQRVLAVYFDRQKKVTRIANYGMKDGKIFDFISRTTPTGGADSNILNGLLRSSFRLS